MNLACEWLQTNRAGCYAMGCVDRVPRRKYHSLLMVREPGHGDPLSTLLEVGEYVESAGSLFMLHGFDFGDRIEPSGFRHLTDFEFRPLPKWRYLVGGITVERQLELDSERAIVRLSYVVRDLRAPTRIRLRPYLLYRPMDHLTRQNAFLDGTVKACSSGPGVNHVEVRPYSPLPALQMRVTGRTSRFEADGQWVERVHHSAERDRGYDATEDAFAPGEFVIELDASDGGEASFVLEFGTDALPQVQSKARTKLATVFKKAPSAPEFSGLTDKLEWAAEKYLVSYKNGFHSLIAGFPWFGSWGRDTFISLPGICLERGDIEAAERILDSYGRQIVQGLKSRGIVCVIPETGLIMTGIDTPLLYIYAVQMLARYAPKSRWTEFMPAVCGILEALRNGADRRVRVTYDCGIYVESGPWAVTWMDVLLDGQPVTPRQGYAVDINALFYNAVRFACDWARKGDPGFAQLWAPMAAQAPRVFLERFWSEEKGYLADCAWDESGNADFSVRPNQLWALALPYSVLGDRLEEFGPRILAVVRQELLTEVGLRTLSPADPKYCGTYRGTQRERDLHYHQGIIWPWLLGIYSDAVERIHGKERMKADVQPILDRLAAHVDEEACLGHVSELFEDLPHQPVGAPAQAWSVAEVLRVAKKLTTRGGKKK